MTIVLPVLAFMGLGLWMLHSAARPLVEHGTRQRRLAEIEREQESLRAERILIMARDAGLITYDETAAWLPRNIATEIEETRP